MKIDFDGHIHTEYCGHANGMSIEAIVTRADELGLKSLLIAEHIFGPEDVKLISRIRKDLAKLDYNCDILVGAEVDVDASKTDGSLVVKNDLLDEADLVIGAVHYVPTAGNYPHSPEDNPLGAEKLIELWRSSLLGMLENPAIDILAHPARLPAAAVDMNIFFDDVLAILAEAAKVSAQKGVVWEMNNLTCARLSPAIMARWHETIQAGVDAGLKITYGSDAHAPKEIAKQGYVQQMLAKLKNFTGLISPADIKGNLFC